MPNHLVPTTSVRRRRMGEGSAEVTNGPIVGNARKVDEGKYYPGAGIGDW